jgi:hypothetical protein
MAEPLKIKVEFSNSAKAILRFITETQEGKYTDLKPDLTQIKFKRLHFEEQDNSNPFDGENEENLLLGVLIN